MKNLLLIVAMVLAGCATSGFDATVKESGYSGKKIVDMKLHNNDCSPFTHYCSSLGAQWNGEKPDLAILIVANKGIQAITRAKLMIDGKEQELSSRTLTKITTPSTLSGSSKGFVVPLSLIRDLSNAERAYIRVFDGSGYKEDRVVDGEKEGWAYHAMKRFIAKVDEVSNGGG